MGLERMWSTKVENGPFGSPVNELNSSWVQKGMNRNLLMSLKEKGKRGEEKDKEEK